MAFKILSKNSVFYTAMNTVEALVPLLLAPLLTRMVSPGDYGYITLYVSYVGVLIPCIGLRLDDYLRMHFFEHDDTGRQQLVSRAMVLVGCIGMAFLLLSHVLAAPLATWLKFPAPWLWVIVAGAFGLSIFRLLLAFNQFADHKRGFFGLHATYTVISLLTIVALLVLGSGWQSYPVGKAIGILVALTVGIRWFVPDLFSSLFSGFYLQRSSITSLKPLLIFGLIYLPAGISLVAGGLIDRVLVAHLLGTDATGLYGVAALFGAALWLPILGFHHAWQPWLFRKLQDREHYGIIIKVSLAYGIALPMVGGIVMLMSWLLAPFIIGATFTDAFTLIPWAVATIVLQGVFMHCQAFLHFYKATTLLSLGSGVFIATNLVLTMILLQSHGLPGVFLATMLAFMIALVFYGVAAVLYRPWHHAASLELTT